MITLFTMIELERLSDRQLVRLRVMLHGFLARSHFESSDRRNILASIENIGRVCNRRRAMNAPSL